MCRLLFVVCWCVLFCGLLVNDCCLYVVCLMLFNVCCRLCVVLWFGMLLVCVLFIVKVFVYIVVLGVAFFVCPFCERCA